MKSMLLAISVLLLYTSNILAVEGEEEKPAATTTAQTRPLTKQEQRFEQIKRILAKNGLIITPDEWNKPKKYTPKSKL